MLWLGTYWFIDSLVTHSHWRIWVPPDRGILHTLRWISDQWGLVVCSCMVWSRMRRLHRRIQRGIPGVPWWLSYPHSMLDWLWLIPSQRSSQTPTNRLPKCTHYRSNPIYVYFQFGTTLCWFCVHNAWRIVVGTHSIGVVMGLQIQPSTISVHYHHTCNWHQITPNLIHQ